MRTTISIDPKIRAMAQARMNALSIPHFSQYLALLIERDAKKRGTLIVVKEESPPYRIEPRKR